MGFLVPYATIEDLPQSVRGHLPIHAQEIYLAAFNNAWTGYAYHSEAEHEEIARRVAWAAVKRRYRKTGAVWTER